LCFGFPFKIVIWLTDEDVPFRRGLDFDRRYAGSLLLDMSQFMGQQMAAFRSFRTVMAFSEINITADRVRIGVD
jgi:hypothetical protein